jgi:hypothetical protein
MTNRTRRNVDPRPVTVPVGAWALAGVCRRNAEHARWRALAYGQVCLEPSDAPPFTVGPLLGHGGELVRPFVVLCQGCGTLVAQVWSSPSAEWQGRPFTWAECTWITDREAKPQRVSIYSMILDSTTADELVTGECPVDGVVGVEVRTLLGLLPGHLERFAQRGQSTKIKAPRVSG